VKYLVLAQSYRANKEILGKKGLEMFFYCPNSDIPWVGEKPNAPTVHISSRSCRLVWARNVVKYLVLAQRYWRQQRFLGSHRGKVGKKKLGIAVYAQSYRADKEILGKK